MSTYETILTENTGDVLTITLNRPERLNAASIPLADEFSAALYDLGDARCVLITGAGKGFCSGADLAARGEASAITSKGGSHKALQNHYNPLVSQILRLPVPVITAVNGAAAGVGCSIALAGDFVLAGSSAYFLQAFVNIGLVPDGGSSWLLARAIGRARATRMMMLGEKISAAQAEEWGLIYKAVEDGGADGGGARIGRTSRRRADARLRHHEAQYRHRARRHHQRCVPRRSRGPAHRGRQRRRDGGGHGLPAKAQARVQGRLSDVVLR